ncbi:hypothetical protein [Clostridium manihotivorum]|uniref:Uncharacterized protein n=1 Tax=Clostridium manihotivorum TaxID=2320868 RepID=A0A3R5QVC5_9CLOT|nr:hypothetical protein [Clostridium manihotivorum]QAA33144.1 hypothetical protein C1I91_16710 [Clostridium manihotivorum]
MKRFEGILENSIIVSIMFAIVAILTPMMGSRLAAIILLTASLIFGLDLKKFDNFFERYYSLLYGKKRYISYKNLTSRKQEEIQKSSIAIYFAYFFASISYVFFNNERITYEALFHNFRLGIFLILLTFAISIVGIKLYNAFMSSAQYILFSLALIGVYITGYFIK